MNKYYLRRPESAGFFGPLSVAEMEEQLETGYMTGEAEALASAGQTLGQLKVATGWVPVSSLVGPPKPRELAFRPHCRKETAVRRTMTAGASGGTWLWLWVGLAISAVGFALHMGVVSNVIGAALVGVGAKSIWWERAKEVRLCTECRRGN